MNAWVKTLGGVEKSAQMGMNTEMKHMITILKANKDSDRGFVEGSQRRRDGESGPAKEQRRPRAGPVPRPDCRR